MKSGVGVMGHTSSHGREHLLCLHCGEEKSGIGWKSAVRSDERLDKPLHQMVGVSRVGLAYVLMCQWHRAPILNGPPGLLL